MTWQALLVGLLGGAAGALISTLLRIRHERGTEFRDRLVRAADDFSTGALQALIGLKDARNTRAVKKPQAEIDAAIERAEDLIDETHARLARVDLLFGADSPAGGAAQQNVIALRNAWRAVREQDSKKYKDRRSDASRSNEAFCRYARAEIRGTPWWQRSRPGSPSPIAE